MLALLGFWGLTWVNLAFLFWALGLRFYLRKGFVRSGSSAMGAGCSSCCARNRSQPAPMALEPTEGEMDAFVLA